MQLFWVSVRYEHVRTNVKRYVFHNVTKTLVTNVICFSRTLLQEMRDYITSYCVTLYFYAIALFITSNNFIPKHLSSLSGALKGSVPFKITLIARRHQQYESCVGKCHVLQSHDSVCEMKTIHFYLRDAVLSRGHRLAGSKLSSPLQETTVLDWQNW